MKKAEMTSENMKKFLATVKRLCRKGVKYTSFVKCFGVLWKRIEL